jgi:hypothetical protein
MLHPAHNIELKKALGTRHEVELVQHKLVLYTYTVFFAPSRLPSSQGRRGLAILGAENGRHPLPDPHTVDLAHAPFAHASSPPHLASRSRLLTGPEVQACPPATRCKA